MVLPTDRELEFGDRGGQGVGEGNGGEAEGDIEWGSDAGVGEWAESGGAGGGVGGGEGAERVGCTGGAWCSHHLRFASTWR